MFAAHFPLTGPVQTVARGELYALVMLIREAQNDSKIEFVTDNKGVYDKYNSGAKVASLSSNCDLYYELFNLLRGKNIQLKVRWMPSHLDEDGTKFWPSNVTKLDVVGNSFADKYAALAAEAVQVPIQVSTDCKFNYNLVKKIQWRIMTIITYLPDRRICKTIRTPKEVAQDLDSRLAKTNHVLSRDGDRFTCTDCLESFKSNDKSFHHWMAGQCIKVPDSNRPVPICGSLHIGNQYIHHSHSVSIHKGLVYCSKCGGRGPHVLKKLARECEPPTDTGRATLQAISLDRLPAGLDCWPSHMTYSQL